MSALEEAFSPLTEAIVERVMAGVRAELKKIELPPKQNPDRSLSKQEVAAKLGLTGNTLMEKVKTGMVPAPFTGKAELPRWSERTIEKYMSGEWRPKT